MAEKTDLLTPLLETRRRRSARPALETLIDLREGRLSDDERERVLERAAVDPEVARELLDTLDYPALPQEEDEPGDERRAKRWRRFRERLSEEQG